jgi:hypothetical protein
VGAHRARRARAWRASSGRWACLSEARVWRRAAPCATVSRRGCGRLS